MHTLVNRNAIFIIATSSFLLCSASSATEAREFLPVGLKEDQVMKE